MIELSREYEKRQSSARGRPSLSAEEYTRAKLNEALKNFDESCPHDVSKACADLVEEMTDVFELSLSEHTIYHRGKGAELMSKFGKSLCKDVLKAYRKRLRENPNFQSYCAGVRRAIGVNLDKQKDDVILVDCRLSDREKKKQAIWHKNARVH